MKREKLLESLRLSPGRKVNLARDFDPAFTGTFEDKEAASGLLQEGIDSLSELQTRLYAEDRQALLIVIQAMDAAGKDGVIKHVMSGLNPQGTQVHSFRPPSEEDLGHDFLWRSACRLPERGHIGIFNRSYYEEVLVVRVHPELLEPQKLPPGRRDDAFWQRRFDAINQFERHLVNHGTRLVKLFLHVSRDVQKQRLLERIHEPDKHWKFSLADIRERDYWPQYTAAYEAMLQHTGTEWAPWYLVPADHKWFTRLAVARILIQQLTEMDPHYPRMSEAEQQMLAAAKAHLESD